MTRPSGLLALLLLPLGLGGCIVVDHDDPPPPPIPLYEPCAFTSQCTVRADRCFRVTVDYGDVVVSDGMCSLYCRDDFDCPGPGLCLSVNGEEPICYEECLDDFDCPPGFACIDTFGDRAAEAVCLPY